VIKKKNMNSIGLDKYVGQISEAREVIVPYTLSSAALMEAAT